MADDKDDKIFIPVNQQEQAQQKHSNNLLAQEVYENVSGFLLQSAQEVCKYEPLNPNIDSPIANLNDCRIHDAILIDGDRGTGKSTVLVNIKNYLEDFLSAKDGSKLSVDDYLWLKPIDPTLMESSDDLLLNTIVAALLSNVELKNELHRSNHKAEFFHKQLQDLSRALEGTQTHQDKFGIDKLRSFMGNQDLAEQIHRLYCIAARITGKKLVVLPIDDVDTSLNFAYDNIEVIRKYLASPYVLPIVSGNADLYHEVIWRHFHGRLTKDSRVNEQSLVKDAQALSRNYLQKVLPLPRQRRMPSIKEYFANDKIYLNCTNGNQPSLTFFYYWVEAVINQQANVGLNTYLNIPVNSIRDLIQLVTICSEQINQLENVEDASQDKVQRLTIMPLLIAQAIGDFASDYGQAADEIDDQTRRFKREQAYQSLEQALMHNDKEKYREIQNNWQDELKQRTEKLLGWNSELQKYLRHKKSAGQSYVVSLANECWLKLSLAESTDKYVGQSVLNSSLFNPFDIQYNHQFDLKFENNKAWSLFQFPAIDSGKTADKLHSIIKNKWIADDDVNDIFDIFYSLTYHRASSQGGSSNDYWRIGRIFELLVMSLVKPVRIRDIEQLISLPPFYSEASLKQKGQIHQQKSQAGEIDEDSMELDGLIEDINQWRKAHFVQVPSSWLIHQLMTKVFANVKVVYRGSDIAFEQQFIEHCYRAFIMIVGACGSVEKSNVFGLGQRVALIEVDDDLDKFRRSDLYNLNIRPFTELPKGVGSVTRSLFYHPIGRMLRQAIDYLAKTNDQKTKEQSQLSTESQNEPVESQEEINQEKAAPEPETENSYEQSDGSYSESSIDDELEADESLEDLDFEPFEAISDFEVKIESKIPDFGGLKLRYGEEQLRDMAIVAGVVFYTTYSMFKGRSVSHGHIKALTEEDFGRLDLQQLAQNMMDAGLPKDFVVIIFKDPKRFLSAKTNYRKLTTFLAKFNALNKSIDESKLIHD